MYPNEKHRRAYLEEKEKKKSHSRSRSVVGFEIWHGGVVVPEPKVALSSRCPGSAFRGLVTSLCTSYGG